MNLISCEHCGVVINKNHLIFPDAYIESNGDYIVRDNAVWDGDQYIATIPCPVCSKPIMEKD